MLPLPCTHQVRRRADLAVGWKNDTAAAGFGKEDKMPKKIAPSALVGWEICAPLAL